MTSESTSHGPEEVGNTIRALPEHNSGFMLHVDQVSTALVGCGEKVVVGDELMYLLLLVGKTLLHESTLGFG